MLIFMFLIIVWVAAVSLVILCKKLGQRGTIPGVEDLEHIKNRVDSVIKLLNYDGNEKFSWEYKSMCDSARNDLMRLSNDIGNALSRENKDQKK